MRVVLTGLERPQSIGFSPCRSFSSGSETVLFPAVADCGAELADRDAAWTELTAMCADLVGGIARQLQQNTEWQMELLDESKKPVFRIRLLAETMETLQPAKASLTATFSSPRL